MISFGEASKIVMAQRHELKVEKLVLADAMNRVLAEDIFCDMNIPPFNKSAVDGYACRKQDLENSLEVVDIIQAGSFSEKKIGENQCAKIMTGAPIPEGANWVIMVEDTTANPDSSISYLGEITKSNIALKAEDVVKGAKVLSKGILIQPQHIAIFATSGYAEIKVYKKIKIGVISTGNELVEPGNPVSFSQIRNSNGHQLIGQIVRAHAIPNYYGIVDDTEQSTRTILKKALKENDILLLTGGVSMGDFDLVPQIMEELNLEILFRKIAVQPGKPTVFATSKNGFCFGLPGNPVSSYIIFELMVLPLIQKLSGMSPQNKTWAFKLSKAISRKKTERDAWLPGQINNDSEVEKLEYHGSAHINALAIANVLIHFPQGISQLDKGEKVNVRFI